MGWGNCNRFGDKISCHISEQESVSTGLVIEDSFHAMIGLHQLEAGLKTIACDDFKTIKTVRKAAKLRSLGVISDALENLHQGLLCAIPIDHCRGRKTPAACR